MKWIWLGAIVIFSVLILSSLPIINAILISLILGGIMALLLQGALDDKADYENGYGLKFEDQEPPK